MRLNGVHVVTATDKACGHEVNVDALPEVMTVPKAGRRPPL